MAFSDRSTNWGCLVSGAFLLFLGLPMLFELAFSGECIDLGNCPDDPMLIVLSTVIVLLSTIAIMWLTNAVVRKLKG